MNVVRKIPVGVVGTIADSSLVRALTKTVGTGDVELGKALTETAGVVANGGSGAFAGIAVAPKQMSKDGLGSTMTVKANGFVEAVTFGRVWVKVSAAVSVGAQATFSTTDGSISSATGAGKTAIANSKFLTEARGAAAAATGTVGTTGYVPAHPDEYVALLELS